MIDYQVTFEGTGFDLFTEDGQRIGGFFVSVTVSAEDLERAFDLAHERLTVSQAYQDLISAKDQPNGMLSVHGYSEIAADELNVPDISGFVFYPPDANAAADGVTEH